MKQGALPMFGQDAVAVAEPWAHAETRTAAEVLQDREAASSPGPASLTDQIAALFRARPNEWIDMHTLARVGGIGGWRTRVSDVRRPPYGLHIENENHRETDPITGATVVVSRYRYVPVVESR